MIVGFTGTQIGMSVHQKEQFGFLILELNPKEFHHGDCIGADTDAHNLIRLLCPDTEIILHPPIIANKRAFNSGNVIHETYDYLTRNHHIVDSVDYMIATPSSDIEELRSGTWATVRYSRKKNKTINILER